MAVTRQTTDFMGRTLVNPTPGTSDATDAMGRKTVAGGTDFMGRSLSGGPAPTAWAATTAYGLAQRVTNSGATLEVTTAGTSAASPPANPAVKGTVVNGTVTFLRVA